MPLRILEIGGVAPNGAQVYRVPFDVVQTPLTVGASGTNRSAAFAGTTKLVVVQADEACHVAFGATPTATTSHFKLAAGDTSTFAVQPGEKLAVIQA